MHEILEGYVVDIGCLRKYPAAELPDRARQHTKECALMGHCVESGYGIVDDSGHLRLHDQAATEHVVRRVRDSEHRAGLRLRVSRERHDGAMRTTEVDELSPTTTKER